MSENPPRHLFEVFGVELEYMIVDAETLSVLPIADRLLQAAAGEIVSDVERGSISWSNELALHVVELKSTDPSPQLQPLAELFQEQVAHVDEYLAPFGARLMPTGMHPWMNPDREMRLWPHDNSPIYQAFHRTFDCTGHGWANLQSVHLNLPFADDAEFGRLHAAIRLLLPILPALSASSPVREGELTGFLDTRLEVYRSNSRRIPSVTGGVIPEPVFTRSEYEQRILQRIYADVAPYDPEGVLQHEWLNARGAIARFERNTIEIRVLDVQECPQADVAVCAVVVTLLRALTAERWRPLHDQQNVPNEILEGVFLAVVRDGEDAAIREPGYLAQFGCEAKSECTAGELWRHLLDSDAAAPLASQPETAAFLEMFRGRGCLSRRIAGALGERPSQERVFSVYRHLCECLAAGKLFG